MQEETAQVASPAEDLRIQTAVLAIARKAHIASGTPDSIYELARTAISAIIGPDAVHDYAEWKTQEKLNWATDQISAALK